MEKIKVSLKTTINSSYEIIVGENAIEKVAPYLATQNHSKHAIITDDNVFRLHGERLLASMRNHGLSPILLSFPPGEKNKNLNTYAKLCQQAYDSGLDRKSIIIALGGGVVGDVAGFVASTYMRGIPFIQIPTTLLAMVDSSVGGKTGVDLQNSKNSTGTFWQPSKVFADPLLLDTLSPPQMQDGFAETIKTAAIADEKFFSFLEKNREKILIQKSMKETIHAIKRACEIKAQTVEKDERENEYRKILNFGHTIGHAIEAATKYSTSHGKAVAIGMTIASRISQQACKMPSTDAIRIEELLKKTGFELALPKNCTPAQLYELAKADKKNVSSKVQFVLLDKIGKVHQKNNKIGIEVDKKTALKAIESLA